jgi:hypothetical protein
MSVQRSTPDWRPPQNKVLAVTLCLARHFAEAEVVDWTDPETICHCFDARSDAGPWFCLSVPRVVFDNFTAAEIVVLMEIAEIPRRMRAESPRRVSLADDPG